MKKFKESSLFVFLVLILSVVINFGLGKLWDNASGDMLLTLGIIIILYDAFAIYFLWEFVTYRIMKSDKKNKDIEDKK